MSSITAPPWKRLGAIRPAGLVAARIELHRAVQLPAALGIARAAPQADSGHHALVFDAERGAFLAPVVSGKRSYRAALRAVGTRLQLLDANHSLVSELALAGRTFAEGLAWLERATERYTGAAGPSLAAPEHALPAHPVAEGGRDGRFRGVEPEHALELACWFADVEHVLAPLALELGAGPLRVWSHHFDLDCVVARGGRTLGLGFSPGDEGCAEPYLYALPQPAPAEPPALEPPFEWTSDGWSGAVLRGANVVALDAARQAELVERFYRTAVDALVRDQRGAPGSSSPA
jgi:hypothetical protein